MEIAPTPAMTKNCMAWVISVYELAINDSIWYRAKPAGTRTSNVPTPPGIGIIMAAVPNSNTVNPAETPRCEVPSKAKKIKKGMKKYIIQISRLYTKNSTFRCRLKIVFTPSMIPSIKD